MGAEMDFTNETTSILWILQRVNQVVHKYRLLCSIVIIFTELYKCKIIITILLIIDNIIYHYYWQLQSSDVYKQTVEKYLLSKQ